MINVYRISGLTGLFVFFCTFFSFAQGGNWSGSGRPGTATSKGIVKGFVKDAESQKALEFATVSIYQLPDSSLITGTITDAKGAFRMEVEPGSYYVMIDFLSYESLQKTGIEVKTGKLMVDIGTINLSSNAEALSEVEVRAERSQMQLSLDKKVYNVGQDMASRGGTAADILDNVPSVTVDIEGNVSLRGSGSVRILVDGKPSTLIGISNSDGLRQLPANLIEKIEVVTNPSSRYEAEGQSGIINIVLSKKQNKGLNGNFDVNTGWPHNHGASFNLNYRKNKFNWFASYGIQYRDRPGFGSLLQEVFSDAQTNILRQRSDRGRASLSNSIRAGADYSFSPKDVLTGSFIYRVSDDNNFVETRYEDFVNSLDNPTFLSIRTDQEDEFEPNLEYSLNYKKDFLLEGRELRFDVQYRESTETESSDLRETTFNPDESPTTIPALVQRSENAEGEKTWLFQSDYIHPIGENGKFEAGWRTQLRNIKNDFLVEEFENETWEVLEGLSNDFRYDEDIHAVYVLYGNKIGKWSYQGGVRMEHSQIRTDLITTGEINDRTFTDFFPSALLNYELPKANSVQVSYSRRIRRPRFFDLNPFFSFSDNRNFFAGNPNLNPEYTNSFELEHIKYWDQVSITSAIFYRQSTGTIQRLRIVADDGTSITQPENFKGSQSLGAEFTFNATVKKWWRTNGDFNFFYFKNEAGDFGDAFDAEDFSWFFRWTHRLTIKEEYDVQLRWNYRAPQNNAQGRRLSIQSLDIGVSRDIFKGKGTLTLNASDVFNSRRRRFEAFGENFVSEGAFQWRARQFTLSLNYRLNQKKKRGGRPGGSYQGGGGEY